MTQPHKNDASTQTTPAGDEPANELQQTFKGLLQCIAGIALPTHIAFLSIFAWCKVDLLAFVNVLSCACFVAVFFLARRNQINLALAMTGIEVVGHAVLASFVIGWASGFHHYVLLVLPVLVMSNLRPLWVKAAATLAVAMSYLGLDLLLRNSTPPHQLPLPVQDGLHYFNIFGTMLIMVFLAGVYYFLINRANEALRSKTQDIDNMLQNMPQGVLTVTRGNVIHAEYSAYLETIFETRDIARRDLMDLVFANTSLDANALSQVQAAAESCIGEDRMNFAFNAHLMVQAFDRTMPDGRVKSLELSWSPICDRHDTVEKLMLCVRDVTELKRLEKESQARKRELEIIGEILAVSQEKFNEFIESANQFIDDNRRLITQAGEKRTDIVNLLFRNMHTVKGNARTYALLYLTNLVHVTEQAYDDLRKKDDAPWDPQALLAQLDELQTMVARYAHINDVVLGRKGPGRRGQVEKFLMVDKDQLHRALGMLAEVDTDDQLAMRSVMVHLGRTLNMVGTEPMEEVLIGPLGALPSLAAELGKQAPAVHIDDHGIMIRTQISGLVSNLFTHLLRNAIDHGLEPASEREALGKPAQGRIHIDVSVEDNRLQIRLTDDGRGLPLAKIRQRAIAQGLLPEDAPHDPQDIAQLIFRSGFSTADQVTEVSGRGVGMDAVRGFLQREGGHIEIRFLDDQTDADFRPFETLISLPDKFAASLDAAMSFEALRARVQALNAAQRGTSAQAQ
ncbi:MAG TPA: ATP-binding protein [Aquabacterium sp.]|uniref:ATP-binding protein n=1 Tax=Aquabacterium sp. TaxID=1872578 RepID=UPI002E2F6A0C|nr:ATP-binding protein [Aquabacterium sp.]HEX5358270.1 ATP-binding protein [Aquabacterium sp.]